MLLPQQQKQNKAQQRKVVTQEWDSEKPEVLIITAVLTLDKSSFIFLFTFSYQ